MKKQDKNTKLAMYEFYLKRRMALIVLPINFIITLILLTFGLISGKLENRLMAVLLLILVGSVVGFIINYKLLKRK